MDKITADAVVKCLEIDVDFYRELTVFLMKKHTKILADDLEWLTNSLNDEQAYLMKSRSLEDKRLELFRGLGISDKKLSELIEDAPEEYKPKMSMLYKQLEELVDNITELNSQTTEVVKREGGNSRKARDLQQKRLEGCGRTVLRAGFQTGIIQLQEDIYASNIFRF